MARIVLEYSTVNTQMGVTTTNDPSRLASAVVGWNSVVPTFYITAGSVVVGGANAIIEGEQLARSDTDFFITGSQRETRGLLASFTNLEFYFKFGGYDFEFGNSGFFQQYPTIRSTPVVNGTITSLDYEYTVSSGAGSSPVGPFSNTSIFNITVTDLSLSAADINFVNYQGIIPLVFSGNDQIFGSIVGDIIDVGAGNDQVYGYEGNDTVYGSDGNDFLVGENGNDQLFGGNDTDWIIGGEGNDWIVGGAGYDTAKGGNGDDGVVFDAGDNLAEYDGGAGYDILFFTAGEDGSAPNYFNLSARGFEQANGSRIDTSNQTWASNVNVYDAAWRMLSSEYVNDNGTKDIFRLDPANNQNWNSIQSHYDAAGKLDYEITLFDDGLSKFLDFDLNNEFVWASRIIQANSAGTVISDTFVLDADLAQRSSEINQKKVIISDALI